MIRATKVLQQPKNLYDEILADFDLDYLWRDDYEKISGGLYKEFMHFGVVKNESDWIQLQVKFLENHSFHTDWAKLNGDPQKAQLLQRVHDKAEALGLSKKAS